MPSVLENSAPGMSGPAFGVAPPRRVGLDRAVAALVALVCLAVLGAAAWLEPNPNGYGTHTQLGFLHGCVWMDRAGIPCPTCGMTTAFAHAAEGHFLAAFLAQPMGLALALGTAMTFWAALYVAVTGSPVGRLMLRLWRPSVVWSVAGLAVVSWLYKIWATMDTGG